MNLQRNTIVTILGVGTAFLLSSCAILGLKKEVEDLEAHGTVTIRVVPPPAGSAQTWGMALATNGNGEDESAGVHAVRPDGIAAFTLRLDRKYEMVAFTDENGNLAYDAGEPLGSVLNIKPQPIADPDVVPVIVEVPLKRDHGIAAGTSIEIPKENADLGTTLPIVIGELADLDDRRFAAEEGGIGLWKPFGFLKSNASGIYFTEEYDPNRIPVVFVYGIGGSPQDWRYFIENFDRENYQLWFAHYPSAVRLGRLGSAIGEELNLLRDRHGFSKAYVVAHSMGGLISRVGVHDAAIMAGENFIPKFVTISTPWGGHKAAEMGIRHMKKPVPSWIDVAPESDLLLAIYSTPLPAGTRHDLIWGAPNPDGKDDGVVTIESQLEDRMKRNASSVTYYPYDHVGILQQPEVLEMVERLLAEP